MNRIEARFQELAERGQAAFIPYITAGDPNLRVTAALVHELERAGADIIEFGIPFSDPIADGPVNQEAAIRALKNNVSLHDVVRLVGELRASTQIPLVLFTYFNPVMAYGIEAFAADAHAAGVDGVLCVDLPPEESEDCKKQLDAKGIATIYLVAPTSPRERVEKIAKLSRGFVYYVSRTGVTGERANLEQKVAAMVRLIKQYTQTPVAVGFGISTPKQAREIARIADGVIVGSAIVRMVGELGDSPDTAPRVGAFVKSLVDAAKGAAAGRA
jgi:tryptophan synthase alpha chain